MQLRTWKWRDSITGVTFLLTENLQCMEPDLWTFSYFHFLHWRQKVEAIHEQQKQIPDNQFKLSLEKEDK